MDVISNLGLGFAVALTIQNTAYCFIGVLLGTIIGVLPGIGPVTTVAMLLPISFTLQPESALILLAGIYYGAQYGGSTTAILVNIPGEASSVVTTIDGHQMARQGRAGPALGIAALGSFFAGSISTLLIALAAPPLAAIALQFGPAEYFSLMVCGLIAAVVLARGSVVKAIGMVVLGLLLGLAGTDVNFGVLPGGGALLAAFGAYTLEKKVAKKPRSFGAGDIRGVAAPESANNAGAQTSFIPMLTLGIPANPTMALMIGAL